jgi:hypothetical protein
MLLKLFKVKLQVYKWYHQIYGSTPSVIRGLGTALGGRTPLYIVDGMPTENINNINTNDITYEILKDAFSNLRY